MDALVRLGAQFENAVWDTQMSHIFTSSQSFSNDLRVNRKCVQNSSIAVVFSTSVKQHNKRSLPMRWIAEGEADFDKVPTAQGVRGERSCLFYGGAEMTKDLMGILARGSF